MKNNKAFTLVEVVAVITILGIILAIAVPRILSAIDESKRATFEISANELLKEASKKAIISGDKLKTYTIKDNEFKGDSLKVKGTLPDEGKISIYDDGGSQIAIHNDKWCAIKYKNQDKVAIIPYDETCDYETPVSCFSYDKTENHIIITGYDYGCTKNVIIPTEIEGLPVERIGTQAFYYRHINSVIMPDTVKTIESQAFIGNSLTSLIIPDSVTTINTTAFFNNKIVHLELGKGLEVLNETIFQGNQIEELTIPDNIVRIRFGTFANNPIKKINIGRGLNSLYYTEGSSSGIQNAFGGNSDNIDITISPLNSIFVSYNGGIYSKDMKTIYFGTKSVINNLPSSVDTIEKYAFADVNITDFIIPSHVKYIIDHAFKGNNIENLTIPNTVLVLRFGSFMYNKIKNLTISNNLTEIETLVFHNNELTNVIIPNNITKIGTQAFSQNKLTSVIIPNSVTSIGPEAFNDNLLPDESAFIYKRKSDGSKDMTTIISYGGARKNNVVIPTNVTILDTNVFSQNSLTSVTIPNSVTTIGYRAFYLNDFTNVTIPSSVTTIGAYAFYNNKLTSLTIPNSVTSIGDYAFLYNQLTSVTMPANVTVKSNTISPYFYNLYNPSKLAGTYIAPSQSGEWTKQ